MVEEAVFHLVLSDLKPRGPTEVMLALQEARGAWLDKSTTIMLFANGAIGANLEHAAADAVVPSRMLVHAAEYAATNEPKILGDALFFANSAKTPIRRIAFNQTLDGVERKASPIVRCKLLPFDVDTPTHEDCLEGTKQLAAIYADNGLETVLIPNFGTKKIKQAGMAPDSFMQMALQLAFALDQDGRTAPTYETATTRAFFHVGSLCELWKHTNSSHT
jgi:carnitine O-acetyltransferase